MQRPSFTFHREWRDAAKGLQPNIRAEIYEAIIEYALTGMVPAGLKNTASAAFSFVRERIDKDAEKYAAICERNRTNGAKSKGRPKTQENPEKPSGLFGLGKEEPPPAPPQEENSENININAHENEPQFDEFYKPYPLKKSKQAAIKAWNKLSVTDKRNAIAGIPLYAEDCLRCSRNYQYPATYLNGRTWEDDFNTQQNYANSNGNNYHRNQTNADLVREAQLRVISSAPFPNVASNEG